MGQALPIRIKLISVASALAGLALFGYLGVGEEWGMSVLAGVAFFMVLIIVTSSFPLPVAPRAVTDVSTAVLFTGALVLEPGVAVVTAVVGKLVSYLILKNLGDSLHLPGYQHPYHKYPFNLGEVAITTGVTSYLFHTMGTGGEFFTLAVEAAAAAAMYLVNTTLVTVIVSLEMKINPFVFWWMGTRANRAAELGLLSLGFLGAVVYEESPWASAVLIIPVAVIYLAFSHLATANTRLEETLERLKSVQGRIVSTSKLASVGALSLDLAHQIKNPLAIILGRLDGLHDGFGAGTKERRNIDIALDAGWRVQELTQTFTHIGRQEWLSLDMRDLLEEGLGMAGLRTSKRIETRWSCADDMPKVHGNPVLIREALYNFFSNAMDAMDAGGRIGVEVAREGEYVVVKISDDGVGIPAGEMKHFFEPFHTTKPDGQGLGLFAAKHILEMHQGSVEMQSYQGVGSTVIVKLPLVGPEVPVNPFEEELAAVR
jgi:signal transduction histidine kinase